MSSKTTNTDHVRPVLRITGRVRTPFEITMEDLLSMNQEVVCDLPLICGTGNPKGTIGDVKGVLLEEILRKADVLREEENATKKMYIVASSDDGYKTVFSWQEIFNTAVGGGVMILTEKGGKTMDGLDRPFELLSTEDYFSGPRYVRRLCNIELVMLA